MGLIGGISPDRVQAPHIEKSKNGALPLVPLLKDRRVGGAPGQSLGKWRIWGSSSSIRRLWPNIPDDYGPGQLGADPSGEERYTHQNTVPFSPQCPQEIVPLPLLHSVLQGTAISSKSFSQLLPGNIAALRGSLPLKTCLEQPSPAGYPFQGTELAVQSIPEATFVRLVPLVHFLAAWKLLPNVSQWVLHTVERGYKIQFGSHPPLFNRVFLTLVGPEQALVMEQEVENLLRKEAIELVPPHDTESGFYSRYFIVPEKWRSASNSRSKTTELLSHETQFQDAYYQASRVPNQVRGLVYDDRSERRLLPHIHSSSTLEVLEVRFQGQSIPISSSSVRPCTFTPHFHEVCGCSLGSIATPGHPHIQLHRRLVDLSSIRAISGSALRCHSRPYERPGVKNKRKEKCASSRTEDHLYGHGVGFDQDRGAIVPCLYRFDPHDSHESERRPVAHCEAFSKAVGSDGSCVQRGNFWPAAHETLAVVAQDHKVFPEGKPISQDQGHAEMLSCLRHVEETVVPVTRLSVGGSLSYFSIGSISSIETLSPRPERPSCASTHRQYSLHQPPSGSSLGSSCGPKGNCSSGRQFSSLGTSIREQTSCRDRGWGPGNGFERNRFGRNLGEPR